MAISDNFRTRIYILSFIFLILAALLIARLFFIQVGGHDAYSARAERQYTVLKSPTSVSVRGNIFFKEKNGDLISAASVKQGFLAALVPKDIKDSEQVCSKAEEILAVKKEGCLEKANKKGDPYEEIAHRVDSKIAEEIKRLALAGLTIYPEKWRYYPAGKLASQVLGFVGYKGDELSGRYGVERFYEDILKGKKTTLNRNVSFATAFFELGKNVLSSGAENGHDLVLTIEPSVQSFLEDILDELMEKWSADTAGAIVVNPKTGAIIAMANRPTFDPNSYNKVENLSNFRNPLVSDILEVGSVMKPLILAAGIDAGKITAKTTYNDQGFVVLDGKRIENYDSKARGVVDMQTVLDQSLNTGAVFVSQKLGKDNFLSYIKNYGLAEKTEIDLPDEVEGQISNLLSGRDVEYATASFGQGIAVSPIEFVSAVSALANGGLLTKPYVVEKIIVEGGKDIITEPFSKRRVLKEESAREMTRMLVKVVDEALLGGVVKMEHYNIAAKTGTAQLVKPKSDGDGYYEDQYLHCFFGYAPAFDARFLIFLYLKKPLGVRYASYSLTEPFMDLTKFLLSYYEIAPDR